MNRFAMLACGLLAILGFAATTEFPDTTTRLTADPAVAVTAPVDPAPKGDSAGWQ
ncbi:hypothetical protein [Streptomyces sp. NPDC056883]|uniref:hypothetical protein n=1 Tax=Streptomyces sp. NPDC056883 TaxID=3345959 RepID=UPI0036BB964B